MSLVYKLSKLAYRTSGSPEERQQRFREAVQNARELVDKHPVVIGALAAGAGTLGLQKLLRKHKKQKVKEE